MQGPRGYPANINGISPDANGNIILTPSMIGAASSPNLLLNWDFRSPVNRQGQTKYVGPGNTIDRWMISAGASSSLELVEEGIKFTNTAASNWFKQNIENPEDYAGSKITASALINSVSAGAQCRVLVQLINLTNNTSNFYGNYTSNGLSSISVELPEDVKSIAVGIVINTANSWAITSSAKLELGPVQTLAHQDADGDWVLNDPPDYALQYALCSQYSPITGEWVGYQYSNSQLLDNAYWARKDAVINQRGQDEYIGQGYAIDRWYLRSNTTNNAVLHLEDGGVRISRPASPGLVALNQRTEFPENLLGKQITFSVLIMENNNDGAIDIAYCRSNSIGLNSNYIVYLSIPAGATGLFSATDVVPNDLSSFSGMNAGIVCHENINIDIKIAAIKLELGPVQTLARRDADGKWVLNDPPPSKQQELAKCQRYQLKISSLINCSGLAWETGASHASVFIPTPVSLRGKPSVPSYSIYSCVQNGKLANITGVSVLNVNESGVRLRLTRDQGWEANYGVDILFNDIFLDANL